MSDDSELSPAPGFVEPEVGAEFPGLRLSTGSRSRRAAGASPPIDVKQRLRELSNRYRGASVVAMRTQPIPHAYRTFFRQIGLDPDVDRIPSEEAAVARLMQGGFRSVGLIEDACLVALVETGVPVWALDAEHVDAGGLGIRTTADADRSAPTAIRSSRVGWSSPTPSKIHALLFGEPLPGTRIGPAAPSGSRCSPSGSTGSRRSTSRRRCGCAPSC